MRNSFYLSVLMLIVAAGCSAPPSGDQPRADYNAVTGRLSRLVFDLN